MFNFNYDTVLSVSHLETNFQVLSMTHCQFCLTFLGRMKFLFSYLCNLIQALFDPISKHIIKLRSECRLKWTISTTNLKIGHVAIWMFYIWTNLNKYFVIKLKLVMFRQYFFRRQPEKKKCKFKMVLKTSLSLSR